MAPKAGFRVRTSQDESHGEAQFRVLAECPSCRVQGALHEIVHCRGSHLEQVEATCRVCGHRERASRCVRDGATARSTEQARVLLEQWADREGEPDLDRFVAGMCGPLNVHAVCELIVKGSHVPTRVDPLESMVPERLVGSGGSPPVGPARNPRPPGRYRPVPPRPPGSEPAPPRRVTTHALAAVLAGGRPPRPAVRRFLDPIVRAAGRPPLDDADLKPWRPLQVPCPDDPETLMAVMAELAEVERHRGPGPWSVVKEFSQAWGVPRAPLEQRAAELRGQRGLGSVRLWYRIRDLLAAERV